VVGEEYGPRLVEATKRVLASGSPESIEYPLAVIGGQRWFVARLSPIVTQNESYRNVSILVRDITARKQIEAELSKAQELIHLAHEAADLGIWQNNLATGAVYLDERACKHYGFDVCEVRLTNVLERVHPQDVERLTTEISTATSPTGSGWFSTEYRVIHPDGSIHWLAISVRVWFEESEGTRRATMGFGTTQDITERKQVEQELQELNRTLEERVKQRTAEVQDLYDNAPTGYHSLDRNGNFVMMNQTELNWLGYSRAEVIGRPASDFITPASLAMFRSVFPVLKQRGWVSDQEIEMVRKDGTIIPVLLSATALYDEQGNFVMSRSTIFDNTERKKAELALRESELQNRLLFEESPDAVILFGEDGRVVQANRAAENLTGWGGEQLRGRRWDELGLVSAEQQERLAAAIVQAMQLNGSFAAADFKFTQADGESRAVGARVFGLNIQGRQHYLATMRDITAEKQVEETLRRANAELERAARAKDEFLANMSHELRTPLNAILGLSEALLEHIRGPLNERQADSLRHIEASGRHLLALINDILDLSKVEAERLELQIDTVPVVDVCQTSLQFVKELALKKRLELTFHLDNHLAKLEADAKRLKQMLVNLLSNAVKFTPDGGQVSLEVTTAAEAGVIRFAVQDTGIGIAPEGLARLFQPFTQLDSSLNRQYEGTGLGLALVRRLAELHGGSVTGESEVGQGSRFTLILPYRPAQAVEAETPVAFPPEPKKGTGSLRSALAAEEAERLAEARILLAEDHEPNIQTIGNYLQAKGYQMVIARNGREAVALAAETRPDLILMDIQMPEMNGLEAIRRLRATPEFAATPIIALTALAMAGDRELCLEAGANQYITKPLSLKGLVEMIKELLEQ
jgi:PAS domain S-box-containing protein